MLNIPLKVFDRPMTQAASFFPIYQGVQRREVQVAACAFSRSTSSCATWLSPGDSPKAKYQEPSAPGTPVGAYTEDTPEDRSRRNRPLPSLRIQAPREPVCPQHLS